MRPYTISEIHHLRDTVRRRALLSPLEVEAQVQTYIMAGITAVDLIQYDEKSRETLMEVACLNSEHIGYCKGAGDA